MAGFSKVGIFIDVWWYYHTTPGGITIPPLGRRLYACRQTLGNLGVRRHSKTNLPCARGFSNWTDLNTCLYHAASLSGHHNLSLSLVWFNGKCRKVMTG